MNEYKETWKEGIKITDLKSGDLIYVSKMIGAYGVIIECKFIKYERGLVTAEVVTIEKDKPWYEVDFPKGKIITARPRKCFLWGKDMNDGWSRCHWFDQKKK